MRDKVMTFGFAALAAVATAGWMRQPAPQMQVQPASLVSNFVPPTEAQPLVDDAVVKANTFSTPATVQTRSAVAPVARSAEPVYQTVAQNRRVRTRDDNYRYRDNAYRNDDYRYEQPQRSTGKSAAIIAGGAATGAAVGAMAGGGKGAAIGAVIGGVAGTVYDRSTYKKTDGWGWKRDRNFQ